MAKVSAYRAVYTRVESDYPRVFFTEWVTEDGIDDMEAILAEQVHYDEEGNPVGSSPTILGWEEKKVDTEP